MKNASLMVVLFVFISACASLGPDQRYDTGMKEKKFLKQNQEAVISSLDGTLRPIASIVMIGSTFWPPSKTTALPNWKNGKSHRFGWMNVPEAIQYATNKTHPQCPASRMKILSGVFLFNNPSILF